MQTKKKKNFFRFFQLLYNELLFRKIKKLIFFLLLYKIKKIIKKVF